MIKNIIFALVILLLTHFTVKSQNLLQASGNVGINTVNPQFPLDVKGLAGFKADVTLYGTENNGESNTNSPSIIFQGTNYAGATMLSAPREQAYGRRGFAISTHSDLSNDRNLVERFRISYEGNVGIGTSTPDAKLAVRGTIHSQAVQVDVDRWPDYVFNSEYQLPTLASVKTYIGLNNHLPDMPNAKSVESMGLNVGEMIKLQTKKIEELTLYLIEKETQLLDQNKRLAVEKRRNEEQDLRIAALEKLILKSTKTTR
jgi:hypothetical protein